jgi:hypothetical protein
LYYFTMTNRISEKLVHLITEERQQYCRLLTPSALERATLFAKPHQTVLRVLSNQTNRDLDGLVYDYYRNPQKRVKALQICQNLVASKQVIRSSFTQNEPWGPAQYSDGMRSATKRFRRLASEMGKAFISITTHSGFGTFRKGASMRRDGGSFVRLPDCRMASTDAMEYYSFSTHFDPFTYFLQVPCVELLGITFYHHIRNSLPRACRYKWWQERAIEEIRALSLDTNDPNEMISATYELFISHELGHSLRIRGKSPILDLGKEFGFSPDDVFRGGLPNKYEIAGWQRIVEGRGAIKDVTFVLGDLLANATLWLSGAPEDTINMLRAFTWLLVRPPSGHATCPRGNTAFLRFTGLGERDGLMNILRTIFRITRDRPSDLAQFLLQRQIQDWKALESMYRK